MKRKLLQPFLIFCSLMPSPKGCALLLFLCMSFYAQATTIYDGGTNTGASEKKTKSTIDKPPFAPPTLTCPSVIINGISYNFIKPIPFNPQTNPNPELGPLSFNVTGEVVLVDNGDGNGNGGCSTITNDLKGKIALISRAECPSQFKAQRAQDAGAIGVIIYNPADGNFKLSGVQPTLTIPVVGLLRADANAVIAALGMGTVSATLYTNLPKPTLSPGTSPAICPGATSFTIPYTATVGSPNTYSISGADITTVTDAPLPANGITVNLSSGATGSSIGYTLTVKNSDNCVSDNIMGSVAVNPAPTRLYVNAAATGANTGLTWTDAFTDLQSALNYTCSGNLTEIWVAKGTYYPTTNPNDRNASFVMKAGVKIYGGFAGTEANLTDRNWTTNPTVLSGDIDHATDPLAVTGSGSTLSITGNSGNSYHVIFNDNNGLTTINSLLDGFTITGGNANGGQVNNIGGGMYNRQSSPSLINCSFSGNQANSGGGGMYNISAAAPSVSNCSFSGNSAYFGGGGMYNASTSSASVSNCIFSGNSATYEGGGMYNSNSFSVINCIFSGNSAGSGGGMYNLGFSSSVTNSSFSGNSATNGGGGGVHNYGAIPSLENCILWGNSSEVVDAANGSTTYTNTLVKGLVAGGFQGTEDPLFVNAVGGDLRLQPCSPAINAGDPATTSATVGNVDLAGNPRFFNNGRVDMGAYEYQGNAVTQPTANASTTTANVCVGNTINLSVRGGNTFSWAGPSNFNSTAQNPSFVGSSTSYSGLYSVTVGNDNCPLTATATVSVQVNPNPVSTPSSNSPICAGQTLQLSATAGGGIYSWEATNYSSNQQNPSRPSATTAMSGVYKLTVSSSNCTTTATISVQVVSQATAQISPSTTQIICQGQALNLTASGGSLYSWNGPGNFNSANAIASLNTSSTSFSGVYKVTVGTGVCTATATVSVQIKSSISVSVGFAPVCLVGNPLNLSASGGDTYRWRGPNGFSSTSASPNKAKTVAKDEGVYSVTVTGNGVCTATSTIRVYYGIGAGDISIANRSPYCKGGPITLTATAAGARSYQWTKQFGMATFTGNPVSITTNAKASDGGLYILFVTGENGCIEKQETLVTVSQVACVGTRLAGEEVEEIEMTINAYPNPVSKTLTVELRLKEAQPLQLKFFNGAGQTIGTWQLNEPSTLHRTELDLSGFKEGVYLLEAQVGQQRAVKRVVKLQYE